MTQRKTGQAQALTELRASLTKHHSDPENKAAPSPYVTCDLKRTEGKHFKAGDGVVKTHSYRITINSTVNQDEATEHWALTVACGQVCVLFFLEVGFSMNQDHSSLPP